jgi:5-methyltetrahydropteroyltriglutamate--homocysteine methyltransferase
MCAALAASASPEGELEFAVDLLNRVVAGITGPILAVHVCRGNWSQKEDVLLAGSYDPLLPYLARMHIQQFVLEYATPRAGSLEALQALPAEAQLGFGAVNPRTTTFESPEAVASRVTQLTQFIAPERIYLNPDCGFGTFADRPVGTPDLAFKKLRILSQAAALLRAGT